MSPIAVRAGNSVISHASQEHIIYVISLHKFGWDNRLTPHRRTQLFARRAHNYLLGVSVQQRQCSTSTARHHRHRCGSLSVRVVFVRFADKTQKQRTVVKGATQAKRASNRNHNQRHHTRGEKKLLQHGGRVYLKKRCGATCDVRRSFLFPLSATLRSEYVVGLR